ncbi:sensor domain-containing diguanylate cyclase [Psychrobacillus sp.]|uniref:sensor domain-containing protein n=1 Tax=Psychrobacillus sp. TaxID=1871623 RepID=UPI0028BD294B|nr:sensor domain-containing diguanylate cyclase [Psychrobacillus sp.]
MNNSMNEHNEVDLIPTLEEYKMIWENTNDAIFMLRKDGSIIQANPALYEILGWRLEEVEGLIKIPFFMDDFTSKEHEKQLELLKSGESIPYFETKRKHKDGTIKDVLASYRAVNKGDVLAVAMYKDITEEKKTKQMLEITENCYRVLVEHSPDAILVQNNGMMTFANIEAVKMIGAQSIDQIIGKSILDYIEITNPDNQNDLNRIFEQAEMVKMAPIVERLVRLDGTKIWVEIIALPVQFEGEVVIQAILRDVTVRKYYEDQLTYMATYDPMTGVINRSAFIEELDETIELAKFSKEKFALLYLDLDKFKEVNDSLGHGVGDSLLVEFAKRMKVNVRHQDVVGRIGGDEFLILIKDIDMEKIEGIVKRMHASFSNPYLIHGKEVISTSSIGIALYPKHANSSEKLMNIADQALYQAKKERNKYKYYNENG